MTVTQAATLLLQHFSPEEREIPDANLYPGRNAAVMAAMNGAMQELFGHGGPWLRQAERGYLIHAPTAVTISVTEGSRSAAITAGWESWMAGCTITIGGSVFDNRISNDSALSLELVAPHDGSSGLTTATVYSDAVNIEDDVMEVVRPVRFDRQHLVPIADDKLNPTRRHDQDYAFHRERLTFQSETRAAEAKGNPVAYSVETWSKGDTYAPGTRLMLVPFPASAGMLDLTVKLRPPVVASIVGNSTELPIPHEFTDSIFLPVALQRLKGCPFFRSDPDKGREIERAFASAMSMARSLNPRSSSGVSLLNPY